MSALKCACKKKFTFSSECVPILSNVTFNTMKFFFQSNSHANKSNKKVHIFSESKFFFQAHIHDDINNIHERVFFSTE